MMHDDTVQLLEILKNDLKNVKNKNQIIETKNIFIKKYLTPMYKQINNV